jgi:DNA-binding NarL/FixJ family response regulator
VSTSCSEGAVADVEPRLASLSEPRAEPLDLRARILVVDDEDEVRRALVVLLEHHGRFDVIGEAPDGQDVPALVAELRPDIVVMDLRMPIVGGIEALHLVRALDPGVRVVMLSAYNDPTLIADAIEAGAFGYLVKGCPAAKLFETLERASVSGSTWRDSKDD